MSEGNLRKEDNNKINISIKDTGFKATSAFLCITDNLQYAIGSLKSEKRIFPLHHTVSIFYIFI